MKAPSSANLQIGYCTNVHAGRSLSEAQHNIERYSIPIKQLVSPEAPLGIGLWFSAESAGKLVDERETGQLRDLLATNGLVPFTFNGFPYGDFHEKVVKQNVYLPSWAEFARLNYTLQLARIQHGLLPPEVEGSISTLPLGWPTGGRAKTWSEVDDAIVTESAKNLHKCAAALHEQYMETGRKIRLAIEPEPGCLIDNCAGVRRFFEEVLATGDSSQDDIIREYIGLCHDICHSAVMFESQDHAISTYSSLGIRVVKVQVSSALEVGFDRPGQQHAVKLDGLRQFAEDRYLHQTCVKSNGEVKFFQDLPLALAHFGTEPVGIWRVHFHVPIFAAQLDSIGTTQKEIEACLQAIRAYQPETKHFEIETYAWDVLPKQHQAESLVESIAREIIWFRDLAS